MRLLLVPLLVFLTGCSKTCEVVQKSSLFINGTCPELMISSLDGCTSKRIDLVAAFKGRNSGQAADYIAERTGDEKWICKVLYVDGLNKVEGVAEKCEGKYKLLINTAEGAEFFPSTTGEHCTIKYQVPRFSFMW